MPANNPTLDDPFHKDNDNDRIDISLKIDFLSQFLLERLTDMNPDIAEEARQSGCYEPFKRKHLGWTLSRQFERCVCADYVKQHGLDGMGSLGEAEEEYRVLQRHMAENEVDFSNDPTRQASHYENLNPDYADTSDFDDEWSEVDLRVDHFHLFLLKKAADKNSFLASDERETGRFEELKEQAFNWLLSRQAEQTIANYSDAELGMSGTNELVKWYKEGMPRSLVQLNNPVP